MTTVAASARRPILRSPSRELGWWAMLVFIATETALFAALLAAYFFVRVGSQSWPQGGISPPSLPRPAVMTGLLLVGSVCAVAAERAARGGARSRLRGLLALMVVLGVAFLALEAWDTSVSLDEYTPHTNAYGSLVYTITGLHGAHVALGVLFVLWGLVLALAGRITPARNLAVQNAALYWHFVSLSWLVIFVSIDLSVRA